MSGASMKAPMSANSMMSSRARLHLPVGDAQQRAGQRDVLAARQVLVEAGLEAEQRGDVAVDRDHALGRADDAGEHQQQRALAGAVGPDDADRLAAAHLEGDVLAAPRTPCRPCSRCGEAREGAAHRGLLVNRRLYWMPRSSHVEARPRASTASAPGRSQACHRARATFAKAGSRRLKTHGAQRRSSDRADATNRTPASSRGPAGRRRRPGRACRPPPSRPCRR